MGYYFTPCINFRKTGLKSTMTTAAAKGTHVKIIKNLLSPCCAEISSIMPPIVPASLLPTATARYHIPKVTAIIRPGTSLLT